MVSAPTAIALLAPLFFAFGVSSRPTDGSAESMLRKCRNTVQKTPAYFVDGLASTEEVVTKLVGKDVKAEDLVFSVEVTCLNPADSTYMNLASTTLGLPAIVIWTKTGPYQHLKPTLTAVFDAQTAYFARTGAYSRDLASLQLVALPAEIKLSLDATATGYLATAWIDRKLSPRCKIQDGEGKVATYVAKGVFSCP